MIFGGILEKQSSGHERRQHPRIEQNVPVKISSDEFDIVTETRNLSRSGVYCRINKYIEPMTKLKIHLLLPFKRNKKVVTKKVSCSGIIVRTESIPGNDAFNVAIFFNDIQTRDADAVADYVSNMMEGQPPQAADK